MQTPFLGGWRSHARQQGTQSVPPEKSATTGRHGAPVYPDPAVAVSGESPADIDRGRPRPSVEGSQLAGATSQVAEPARPHDLTDDEEEVPSSRPSMASA